MDADKKKKLYEYYRNAGYKLKVYDYPTVYVAGGKRHLREFDAEDLLFRKPLVVADEHTHEYYHDKVVLITGGGGYRIRIMQTDGKNASEAASHFRYL